MHTAWFLLALLVVPSLCATYKAAIASHIVVSGSSTAQTIKQNLAVYSEHAAVAASKGAQILVYPEFGIGENEMFHQRSKALEYGEQIPNSLGVNFCGQNGTSPLILSTLSCLAKKYSMVVVANVYDKQPCTSGCRTDHTYLYNTEVAFDEKGNLISKYYKTHVWFTSIFDTPTAPTLTNFTTSFGVNFGMMICFDIAFGSPGPQLVNRGIKHFPYSVSQGIVGPLVVEAWTFFHKVTVLSGNLGTHVGAYQRGSALDGTSYPLSNGQDNVFVVDVPF